jgi:hypothetical protein
MTAEEHPDLHTDFRIIERHRLIQAGQDGIKDFAIPLIRQERRSYVFEKESGRLLMILDPLVATREDLFEFLWSRAMIPFEFWTLEDDRVIQHNEILYP